MSMNKTIILVSTGLVAVVIILLFTFDGKGKNYATNSAGEVEIVQTWRMPDLLNEVSGIAFIDEHRVAAVQDERGSIFIYDLKTSEISKEIPFAGSGDYEGIALAENTAYVVKSNGTIYEVANFLDDPKVQEYVTPLQTRNDVEGLFLDRKENRLLLALKGKSFAEEDHKGVYAFDLGNKQFNTVPVYKLKFEGEEFKDVADEDVEDRFFPSEINMDPATGELLLLEAEEPRLLITSPLGEAKKLYCLGKDNFPQPEGLAFDNSGKLYISNEGNPATIHQVDIK